VLKIRLQRYGRKNRPNYRVVVTEHTAPIQGSYIDLLGSFDPLVEKHGLKVDTAKMEAWIKKGAKPTNTVARLLKGQGVSGMDSFIIEMKDKAVKNPKEAPEAPAPAAPAAETPAAETAAPEAPAEDKPAEPEAVPEEEKKKEEPKAEEPAEEKKEEEEAPAEEPKEEEKPAEEPKEEEKPAEEPKAEEPASEEEKTA
jgi:small subunit ribosomal protein S16